MPGSRNSDGSDQHDSTITLLEHCHPVDGRLVIALRDGRVTVTCRWPFDLDENDFIHVGVTLAPEDFSSCVRDLLEHDEGRAVGAGGGFLALRTRADRLIAVEMADDGSPAPTRIELHLPLPPAQLRLLAESCRRIGRATVLPAPRRVGPPLHE